MISRVLQMLLLFAALATSSLTAAEDATSDFRFLEVYASVWNTHDANMLAALFTADADLIMVSLPLVVGRDAIRDFRHTYFPGIDEGRMGEFGLLSSRVIAPVVGRCSIARL